MADSLFRRAHHLPRWVVALAVCLATAEAPAATVNVSTTLLAGGRPEWRAGSSLGTTQSVLWMNLSAREEQSPLAESLRFQLGAWARGMGQFGESAGGEAAVDADLVYLQGEFLKGQLKVTLGRQVVTGGAARFLHLDGLLVEGRLANGVGVSVYGGLQTLPRFTSGKGDAATGARLFWRPTFESEVGASIIQVLDKGLIARQEAGVDGRWALSSHLVLNASALFSLVESRLAEGELAAQWQALPSLLVRGDVRRTAPDLYIPRSSIFSVFSEEERDQAGASAAWRPERSAWGLYGEYHVVRTAEGVGHDAGARATLRLARRSSLGAQTRLLSLATNGYVQGRVWAQHALTSAVALNAELEGTLLEAPVNGGRHSLTASASATWGFAPGWRAMLSAVAGTNPFFVSRYELLARLSYDFSFSAGNTP